MLSVAFPKGRIAEDTLEIFESIFGSGFRFDDRKLILQTENFKFLLVRNQDVATYVYHQAADIGVVGLDTLEEQGLDVIRLLDLQKGKCRVAIRNRAGEKPDFTKSEIKVATKMVNITKRYFAERAVAADIKTLRFHRARSPCRACRYDRRCRRDREYDEAKRFGSSRDYHGVDHPSHCQQK